MRARRRGWAAVLLAVTGGMAGLGPVLLATAPPAWAFMAPVDVLDREYSPRVREIRVGDKVLWRNKSDQKHSVTADSGNWEFDYTLGTQGATLEKRFEAPGTYTYHCKYHSEMTGTVIVNDPNAPPPPPPTTTTAPPTTTTTAPTTTTTAAPTTTTTEPPTTTTTPLRPPAGVNPPPVPATAAAPPPTLATSSTTTLPSSTTTTVPPTTATTTPPTTAGDQVAAPGTTVPSAPPSTEAPRPDDTGDEIPAAAGPSSRGGDATDPATVALVSALVAVGLFGAWTLIRVRPGRI